MCKPQEPLKITFLKTFFKHLNCLEMLFRYNSDGYVENLPSMISGRYSHGCSGFELLRIFKRSNANSNYTDKQNIYVLTKTKNTNVTFTV